eukprot:CAMPEP_0182913570 /NCGR_PEP_ID=MMETSP0034_2-20130328/38109_1 /TAXON_ID=156128 /ORGANISM="Nephroselmis pyriformis, Strain CCMP717" /LENGTH=909 /DNA_ID=CAMNT_0025050297 /DNA_START=368 /DNA_END=3097 /DNA_ORIENTATION=+
MTINSDSNDVEMVVAAAQQSDCPSPVLPCPGFEGSEKRLEIDFFAPPSATDGFRGFRNVTRTQLDDMLSDAGCTIVSTVLSDEYDAYVLSESSLFVYPTKVVIKTCGTISLFKAVPSMLSFAAEHGLEARRCKFSRLSYLWPELQPAPHHCWNQECAALDLHFGHFGQGSSSYVMGSPNKGAVWHVYSADAEGVAPPSEAPTYTLELCMTGLDETCAKHYFRGDDFVSSADTTRKSGIGALFPTAEIDDYVFEPCGYSMNAIDEYAFGTIHITPEAGFSYASCELSGFKHTDYNPSNVVRQVASVFQPEVLTVTMSVDCLPKHGSGSWDLPIAAPKGYDYLGGTSQIMSCGGRVTFHSFRLPAAAPAASAGVIKRAPSFLVPASPMVAHSQSFRSISEASTDSEDGTDDAEAPRPKTFDAPPSKTFDAPPSKTFAEEETLALPQTSDVSTDSDDSEAGEQLNLERARSPRDDIPALPSAKYARRLGQGAVSAAMDDYMTEVIKSSAAEAVDCYGRAAIAEHDLESSFYVIDLGVVQRLHASWMGLLPRVEPHYAVKCNPDPAIIATLAACGAGFDCASMAEIEMVLDAGVAAERIIFANPCKLPSHIRHAAVRNVTMTTFDTLCELRKLKREFPGADCVLRLRADDPDARCCLGNKFGAEPEDAPRLLEAAKDLGLRVVGCSFHVGSGASNPLAFSRAIRLARDAFDCGLAMGHEMTMLDIGGGFSGGYDGNGDLVLRRVAKAVNGALEEHFPIEGGVRVIAEPGRYFVEACSTLFSNVYGKRERVSPEAEPEYDYWISDGLYGSMNCVLYDHAVLTSRPLKMAPTPTHSAEGEELAVTEYNTTVFGPTCDGLDTVFRNVSMEELFEGDWVVFPLMGAYTCAAGSNFNGFDCTNPVKFYVCSMLDETSV